MKSRIEHFMSEDLHVRCQASPQQICIFHMERSDKSLNMLQIKFSIHLLVIKLPIWAFSLTSMYWGSSQTYIYIGKFPVFVQPCNRDLSYNFIDIECLYIYLSQENVDWICCRNRRVRILSQSRQYNKFLCQTRQRVYSSSLRLEAKCWL